MVVIKLFLTLRIETYKDRMPFFPIIEEVEDPPKKPSTILEVISPNRRQWEQGTIDGGVNNLNQVNGVHCAAGSTCIIQRPSNHQQQQRPITTNPSRPTSSITADWP